MNLRVGSATDVGRARAAKANEDSFLVATEAGVYAVADGMGGHRAGDVASATALEVVERELAAGTALAEAVASANAEVFARAQENPDMRGMGTTVTAAQFGDGSLHIAHVGDSRAYLFRDGQLTQVTDDHSLVEELVREGRLSPDEAAVHPQRSIITRALGVDEAVDVDTYDFDLRPDDRVLLCSDGLTSMLRDAAITRVLRGQRDPQKAADKLVAAANDAGGEDNITVIVIDAVGDDAGRAAAKARAFSAGGAIDGGGEATGEWDRVEPVGVDPDTEPATAGRSIGASALRVARWAVPVVAILAVALAAMGWYARSNYHVGLDRDRVVLYQGVPGGFLFWDPTVVTRSDLTTEDLRANDLEQVRDGKEFSSKGGAERFLRNLETKATTTTTTSSSSPTTTSSSAPRR